MCYNCKELIIGNEFEDHSKPCKLYGKFLKRISEGFECKICQSKKKFRDAMFKHVERKHFRTAANAYSNSSGFKTDNSINKHKRKQEIVERKSFEDCEDSSLDNCLNPLTCSRCVKL